MMKVQQFCRAIIASGDHIQTNINDRGTFAKAWGKANYRQSGVPLAR